MKSTPVSFVFTAILRVTEAPQVHDELTKRFGKPDACFVEPSEERGSLWTKESPLSASEDINRHFSWAADLVASDEPYFKSLVSSGIRVTLHLGCSTNIEYALLGFDTELFAPFVRTGIQIEFYAGLKEEV